MTLEQLESPVRETACSLEPAFTLPGSEASGSQAALQLVEVDISPGDAAAMGAAPAAEPHRLVRNFGALFGAQLVTWTMTLLWTLIGPRLIGPGQFGIINTALSVGGVLLIFAGLGSSVYLVREIVSHPTQREKLVGTATVLKLMLAPVMVIGAVMFVTLAHYSHEQTLAVYLAAVGSIAALVTDVQTGAFQALERMHYIAYANIINKTGQSLIGIVIALAGLGATGIVANTTVLALVVTVLQFGWLRRHHRIDFRTNTRLLKSMAKDSMPFWATGLFFTFYLWIDTILLSLLTTSKVVGWYAASTTLATTMMFLPQALAQTWLPRLVAAFNHSERELFRTARTPVTLVLLTGVPIAAAMAMAAHEIVYVLYGSAYGRAVPVMVILAFFIPPTYVNIMINQVLIASGRQMIATWTMVGAAIVNPLLNLVLIPLTQHRYHNGAIGAAIALMLTELLIAVVGVVIVGRHVFDRTAIRRCVLVTAASGAMWGVAWVARPVGALIALTAGVITLVVLIRALRILTPEDITFMRSSLARVRARVTR